MAGRGGFGASAWRRAAVPSLAVLALLAGCAGPTATTATATGAATVAPAAPVLQPRACPEGLPAGTRCLAGTDAAGAAVVVALPAGWRAADGELVVHAHGGPTLGPPKLERTLEDLQRWQIVVRAGTAWAGTSYARGGVAVLPAAADLLRLRALFVAELGPPRRIWLHGQSWGASVAARAAESGPDGRPAPWDGVLLTSGVLAGGSRAYDARLDLRVLYQDLCHNHPRPDEPQYPLWQGLPPGSALTHAELARRADDCLGLRLPAAQRSAEQAARLRQLVATSGIAEHHLLTHLNWATWHFQDIAQHRTGGGNVFGNRGVRYRGSDDDAALNARLPRYAADPAAVARFAADTDPTGRIDRPVLTVHGIADPTAYVEMDAEFAATMARAGRAANLVQTFTRHAGHSYLADPVYPALLAALRDWALQGDKPTPAAVAARCRALEAQFGAGCRFDVDFRPQALETRVPARLRP